MPSEYHLIIDGQTADESWVYVDDAAALSDAPSIVSLARLKTEADSLRARNGKLGVVLAADGEGKTSLGEDVHELAPYLDMLSLVSLRFPIYRNGRGYSAARVLREQLGFTGELRASGEVLYDQWAMMARCGINGFEIAADISLETFQTALGELSGAYQPAADTQRGALWARHAK
ncbi:MAG: DUF934 domain-containing protein [Parvibaculales bacterium]